MFNLPQRIIVFDTEYTTWEGAKERDWSGPNEYREIVQIGAVKIETKTLDFAELDSKTLYVRPVKNPKFSDFFIDLTGVTQKKVDENGQTLEIAIGDFFKWSGGDQLFSWGSDGAVILENCSLLHISCPFPPERFNNIRGVFSAVGIETENYMSSTIVQAFGEKSRYRGHDGLNDARTIVDGLRLLAKQNIIRK